MTKYSKSAICTRSFVFLLFEMGFCGCEHMQSKVRRSQRETKETNVIVQGPYVCETLFCLFSSV